MIPELKNVGPGEKSAAATCHVATEPAQRVSPPRFCGDWRGCCCAWPGLQLGRPARETTTEALQPNAGTWRFGPDMVELLVAALEARTKQKPAKPPALCVARFVAACSCYLPAVVPFTSYWAALC